MGYGKDDEVDAEAMRMPDRIGAIVPGLLADIIALDGDPLKEMSEVLRLRLSVKKRKFGYPFDRRRIEYFRQNCSLPPPSK